jgi:SPOR domain
VAVENDVKRLIAHFLAAVDRARSTATPSDEAPVPDQSSKNAPSVSPTSDHTPCYVWLGRFDREEAAQITAKKVQDLGLPVTVVPRHSSNTDFFVVVTGPYGPERVDSAVAYLKTQGFSDVRVIKNPLAAGSKEPD